MIGGALYCALLQDTKTLEHKVSFESLIVPSLILPLQTWNHMMEGVNIMKSLFVA